MATIDPRKVLKAYVKTAGSQAQAASQLKISPTYLSELLRGIRAPGPKVLRALGLARTTVYSSR